MPVVSGLEVSGLVVSGPEISEVDFATSALTAITRHKAYRPDNRFIFTPNLKKQTKQSKIQFHGSKQFTCNQKVGRSEP
ncbi:hypothetical protein [Rubripirellula obstinata]|uniref:hypothetical protein n=1 Tax=Rubripirellula obstinata TaxID=406547 RepID=UPI0008346966|nr:hypothetical protein [Rubripirellula obstinata]